MRSSCELLLYFIYFFLAFVENADFKKFLFTSSAEMRQFSSLLTHFYDLKAYDRHKCKKFFIIISHLHTNGNFMLQSQKFFITFIFSLLVSSWTKIAHETIPRRCWKYQRLILDVGWLISSRHVWKISFKNFQPTQTIFM